MDQKIPEICGTKFETFLSDAFHIGIAAILGGMIRVYLLDEFKALGITNSFSSTFPTFPVNFLGCLVMGFFVAAKTRINNYSSSLGLFIGTGFCGSLTTWSTWNLLASQIMITGNWPIGLT